MLADVYAETGDYIMAAETYKEVTRFDNSDPDIWLDFSDSYAQIKDFKNAIITIKKGLEIQPDNDQLIYRLANYGFMCGERKRGIIKPGNRLDYKFR